MKRILSFALILLPLTVVGQRLSEEQSKHRIEQLQHLMQHYQPHLACDFEYYPDCGFVVFTDSTDWQGIVALDGTILLPAKYIVYRQIIEEHPSPYFLVLSEDKMGIIDKEMRWVLPMECDYDGSCLRGCYMPNMHHWLEEGHSCLAKFKPEKSHAEGSPKTTTPKTPRLAINGPYESLDTLFDGLFLFYTDNPGDRGDYIFGYVDIYGNTTATPTQLATMEKWMSGVIDYDVKPIQITSIVPCKEAENDYATVLSCLSDTHSVGYLLVPNGDSISMARFNRCVSEDLWGKAVGISHKRFDAGLSDVRQAEMLLAELMKDDVLPRFGRRRRYIGNTSNYTKYKRVYGFYYNEDGERCVYIEMNLREFHDYRIGFRQMWDACDAVAYINLNLESRKVIRAYGSSCQSY